MNILQKAYRDFETYVVSRASNLTIFVEAEARREARGGAVSGELERSAVTMREQTLEQWKRGLASATDPDNPDWTMLYNLHENLMLDDHLESVIESRIAHTQRRPVKFVDAKGNENKELSSLLERPWYEELIKIALGSTFRGRRLLEMYELNSNGELETVDEILQPWFNTKKGIIMKRPGETTGWNYREGVFADLYVQIGKDHNTGMLSRMAPIVLAKKLGMGSWLDFIDKYGVPPLFITTDREDNTRLTQLWNAAVKFKSNNFMIGRGQERFEVPNISGAGTDPFDTLCTRADNMMSKRVLGGTGLTDEKGFVGSVEIQYQLAKNRFDSDGLFFKYFFNSQIIPRLVKLSPVYKPLANFRLEYDNTESLSQKEIINTVTQLGNLYDIDPEYITQVTGIPILGKRQTAAPEVAPEKK